MHAKSEGHSRAKADIGKSRTAKHGKIRQAHTARAERDQTTFGLWRWKRHFSKMGTKIVTRQHCDISSLGQILLGRECWRGLWLNVILNDSRSFIHALKLDFLLKYGLES
jgi:hypothetical protein